RARPRRRKPQAGALDPRLRGAKRAGARGVRAADAVRHDRLPGVRAGAWVADDRGSEQVADLRRAFVVVIDACGVGALPDAAAYGDAGADTLGNLARVTGGLELPTLGGLGLGSIVALEG